MSSPSDMKSFGTPPSSLNSPPYSPTPPPRTPNKTTPKKRSSNHPTSSPARTEAATPSPRKKGRPAVKSEKAEGSESGRKKGSWTKLEVRQLWDSVIVIPGSVSWARVAEQVDGRDKLSCSNKWRYDLLPKVQAFIDSLGD